MREGLYKIKFETQRGSGEGVVFLQGGKLWGGDSATYYVGTYKLEGDKFTAKVKIDHHTKHTGITSVFGVDRYKLKIKGRAEGDGVASAKGASPDAPDITFVTTLQWLSD